MKIDIIKITKHINENTLKIILGIFIRITFRQH